MRSRTCAYGGRGARAQQQPRLVESLVRLAFVGPLLVEHVPLVVPLLVGDAQPRDGVALTDSHRTGHGSTKRDPHQRAKFMRSPPSPSTGKTSGACPGYVVDHIKPLKRGVADAPSNMQWQTKEAAKAKDKWE